MIFFRLPLQKKPSPEHGDTGEGLSEWRGFKNLNLHAARYCYYMQHIYMQLVTPSDAATAVTIDNKI